MYKKTQFPEMMNTEQAARYIGIDTGKREVLSKIMNDIAGDETCPMNIAADIYYAVDCIPAADVEPVRHGSWEVGYFHDRVCSCCTHPDNDLDDYPHLYCPNCGAKMDKKDGQRR